MQASWKFISSTMQSRNNPESRKRKWISKYHGSMDVDFRFANFDFTKIHVESFQLLLKKKIAFGMLKNLIVKKIAMEVSSNLSKYKITKNTKTQCIHLPRYLHSLFKKNVLNSILISHQEKVPISRKFANQALFKKFFTFYQWKGCRVYCTYHILSPEGRRVKSKNHELAEKLDFHHLHLKISLSI